MATANAIRRGFCGFELGSSGVSQQFNLAVVTTGPRAARSGEFFVKQLILTASLNVGISLATDVQTFIGSGMAGGDQCKGIERAWVRIIQRPSADGVMLCGFGVNSGDAFRGWCGHNTNGTFCAGVLNSAGASSSAVLALNTWYCVETTSVVTAGTPNSIAISVSIFTESLTLVETVTASTTVAGGTSFPNPGLGHATGAVSATVEVDYDDCVWCVGDGTEAANVALPSAYRIHRVPVTAQGASADWSNDWRGVAECPLDRNTNITASLNEQSTSTNNASTTFTHDTAGTLRLSGIVGFKVYGYTKGASGGNDAFLINGTEYPIATPATSYSTLMSQIATWVQSGWAEITAATFDAMEFGARNKRGVSIQLGQMVGEALHGGSGPAALARPGSWKHRVVTWVGDGSWREITDPGFASDVIIVKKLGGSFDTTGAVWTRDMGANRSYRLGTSGTIDNTQGVQGVTATGFKLGPSLAVNESGRTYIALCIADGGLHPTGSFLKTGVFIGTNVDNRDVDTTIVPSTAFIVGGTDLVCRTPNMVGDYSWPIGVDLSNGNHIQQFNATGFQVGTDGRVNSLRLRYYWFAMRADALLAPFFAADRLTMGPSLTVSGLLFTPDFVAAARQSTSSACFRRVDVHTGTDSTRWNTGANAVGTGVVAMNVDGWTGAIDVAANGFNTAYFALPRFGEIPVSEVEPVVSDDIAGKTVPLIWSEWSRDDGSTLSVAKVRICDPSTYYGGHKLPLALSIGDVKRALSDLKGNYEGSSWSWVASDLSRDFRTMLASIANRKNFINRNVVGRMIGDADRRLLKVPRVIFRGVLRNYQLVDELKFEFTAEDPFASKVSFTNLDKTIPRKVISRALFTDCPTTVIDQPIPIVYGTFSDAIGALTVPQITGDPSRGAYADGGVYWGSGYGDLTSDAATPTGLAINTAAGGALSASAPNAQYGVIVTAIDASGRESNPTPFFYNIDYAGTRGGFGGTPVPYVTVDGTQKAQVSWNASAGAVKYRCYLGVYYYGMRFTQFIETASTSCEFTKDVGWGSPTQDNITPGAQLIQFSFFDWYAVSAVGPDGESALSAVVFGASNPYRRPVRIQWLAVTGATSYRIYRKSVITDWDRRWEVPASQTYFDDDLLDTGVTYISGTPAATGLVPLIYVGTENISGALWHRWLVQLGCSKDVDDLFLDGVKMDSGTYGVTWLLPRKTGWPFAQNYRDVGSTPVRVTLVYGRGPDADAIVNGSKKLTANVKGIEHVGDGSGTLITSLPLIYKHFIVNFGFQDSNGGIGGWLTSPSWTDAYSPTPVSQIDEPSFDAVDAIAQRRLSGGYTGAALIGGNNEKTSLREIIKRFNASGDIRCGFNRNSQFFVTMFDESLSVLSAARRVTQARHIDTRSFQLTDKVDDLVNVQPYSYGRNFKTNTWRVDAAATSVRDQTSIDDYRETKTGTPLELWFVQSATVALDIANRSLMFTKHAPRRATWQEPLSGLLTELGGIVKCTHLDGDGATGFVDRALWADRHDFSCDKIGVRFEAYDVDRLFSGAFILGDDTWAVDYMSASAVQRQYGFLCSDTTGAFSNGDEGKRLR